MNAVALAPNVPHTHKLSVDEFLILNDNGAFEGFSKSELIDGEIVGSNGQCAGHARIAAQLLVAVATALRDVGCDLQALLMVSVRLSERSLPQPDLVLTRYRGDGVVPVETVALLVEVADTTLRTDLGAKSDLYASAGVAEYWVVDTEGRRIVCRTVPHDDRYHVETEVRFGDPLTAATIPGLSVDTTILRD